MTVGADFLVRRGGWVCGRVFKGRRQGRGGDTKMVGNRLGGLGM